MKAPSKKVAAALEPRGDPTPRVRLMLTRAECQTLQDALEDRMPPAETAAARYKALQLLLHTLTEPGVKDTTADRLPWMESYNALELEIERADALASLVTDRLPSLSEETPDDRELYALSLVATNVSDKLQLILQHAIAVHDTAIKELSAERKGGTK